MADHTRLKGVASFEDSRISDQLETNLTGFLDWGLLNVGGFFNVTFPAQGTRLRRVSDPDLPAGRVYEAYRQGWVWESGVAAPFRPVAVSGVWVNGTFLPAGSGYTIDYPLGRVVFEDSLPAGAVVQAEYSFRRVRTATSDSEWFQQLQFGTYVAEDPQFVEVGSGAWNVLAQNRVQLPAVVIEAVNRVRLRGKEVGSEYRVHQQDVLFHVLAETPFDREQLHDMLIEQWHHDIVLFDVNAVSAADAWPLDENGSPRPGAMLYPAMVAPSGEGGFAWRQASFVEAASEPQESYPPLYRATVRMTVEVDLP